jgi:hypothetical protein
MKIWAPLLFLFTIITVSANADTITPVDTVKLDQRIEQILSASTLSLKDKTPVQQLAFEYLAKKQAKSTGQLSELDAVAQAAADKVKTYSAFTSALAVKLIEMASYVGVQADEFITDSWMGKMALFATFYFQGGEHLFSILWMFIFSIIIIYTFKKITMYICFDGSFRLDDEHYRILQVKRSWLGLLLFKTPTKQKKVLLKPLFSRKDNDVSFLVVVYLFNTLGAFAAFLGFNAIVSL